MPLTNHDVTEFVWGKVAHHHAIHKPIDAKSTVASHILGDKFLI
jgi:hypothetical protein